MITLFTIPKPFLGFHDIIQKNAIKSWMQLMPECQIILINDEKDTACKVAEELGLDCLKEVRRNEQGLPLLDDVFSRVPKIARNKKLAYINSDLITIEGFLEIAKSINFPHFLAAGRAWDLDLKKKIDFSDPYWKKELDKERQKRGRLQRMSGTDYWIFSRDSDFEFPSFVVGDRGVDNWIIFKSRAMGLPVIDTTPAVRVIHQEHEPFEKRPSYHPSQEKRSIDLAGGFINMMTLRDADWVFAPGGLKKVSFPRSIFSSLSLFYPWRIALSAKRKIQSSFYEK